MTYRIKPIATDSADSRVDHGQLESDTANEEEGIFEYKDEEEVELLPGDGQEIRK